MGREWEYQKQIDRACSAQSKEMLPQRHSQKKLDEAAERIKKAQG